MATLTRKLAGEYSVLYESCLVRPKSQSGGRADRPAGSRRTRGATTRWPRRSKMPWYVVAVIHSMEVGRRFHPPSPQRRPVEKPDDARSGRTPEDRQTAVHVGGERDRRFSATRASPRGRTGASRGRSTSSRATTAGAIATTTRPCSRPTSGASRTTTREGKYVADGRFSPTAVSQQCGAAVLLKRLQDGGRVARGDGPAGAPARQPARGGD